MNKYEGLDIKTTSHVVAIQDALNKIILYKDKNKREIFLKNSVANELFNLNYSKLNAKEKEYVDGFILKYFI